MFARRQDNWLASDSRTPDAGKGLMTSQHSNFGNHGRLAYSHGFSLTLDNVKIDYTILAGGTCRDRGQRQSRAGEYQPWKPVRAGLQVQDRNHSSHI